MSSRTDFYKDIIYNSMVGYAHHKIILNNVGEPCNYEFIEVNPAFEVFTNLKTENIVGKMVTDIIPEITNDDFDWINEYGDIALNGGKKSFQRYSFPLKKYYKVIVYSPEKYYFVTLITELFDLEIKYYESQNKVKSVMEDLMLLLDSTGEGIFGIDIEGQCTFCNKSCLDILGYEDESELIGKSMHKLIHYKDKDGKLNCEDNCLIFNKVKRGEGVQVKGDIFWKKDGSYIYVDCLSYPKLNKGKLVGGVVTFLDITESQKLENQLKESERSKSMFLSNLPGMAYSCNYDRQWTMKFISEGCFELTGYRPESFLNNRDLSFNAIIDTKYQDFLWEKWNLALRNHHAFKEEYEILTALGEKKWVLEQGQGVYGKGGTVEAIEGLIIDISDRKQKEDEIKYLNSYDYMTGLYNRRYFENAKEDIDKEDSLPISIIMGDVNGVKFINDALGHDEGDKLIVVTSQLLKSVCKETNILARTGGDEFIMLLPNTCSVETEKRIKMIEEIFEKYNGNIEDKKHFISISLGSSTKNDNEQSLDEIIKNAENNMYRIKLSERKSSHNAIISSLKTTMYGKNQAPDMHEARLADLAIKMCKALNLPTHDTQEITLLATLHDIGKIGIDDNIIKKSDKLTEKEWMEIKTHSEIGYRIAMASAELTAIAEYILYHHERWDGKGYPKGLKDIDIPLPSRIIAIVDAYDAMISDKPYRKAMTKEQAVEELKVNAGMQFDPELVKVFLEKVMP